MTFRTSRVLGAALVLVVFALVTPVFAQQYTGRIDVVIEDATGGRIPGVTVEITGPLDQTMVTDARGEAHFVNLPVGTYEVRATIQGFNEYRNTNVPVVAGGSVPLSIKMAVAGTKEAVQVTAETPVIDTKKLGTVTSVSLDELQNIPTARDPWVVMQSIPGISMDRVNVGGSESGQQAGYMGKGSMAAQTTWNVDGMPITDMSSLSSPFYYDFDMFQEMSVATGGADAKSATSGVQLNFMLKGGTNRFHGSARMFYENQSMQATNLDPADPNFSGVIGTSRKGNRTDYYKDMGGELGGPILKDRWWFWGAYGRTDVKILTLNDVGDRTLLPNISLKTQAQLSKAARASFTYFSANKKKWGRNASATRPQETTWDQDGPNDLFKGELNYVVGNNLFLVGRVGYVKGGFTFEPEGGMGTQVYQDDSGVWHGSYANYATDRPQKMVVVDGNYFRGNHELRFGFSWKKTEVHSTSQWAGNQIVTIFNGYPNVYAKAIAPWAADGASSGINFYVGDTVTTKRATINLGIRFDRGAAWVLPSKEAAVAGINMLPAITAPGVDKVLGTTALQPRVGLTYALDQANKSQLRASYALFTDQINTGAGTFMSLATYRYVYYNAVDKNGNKIADLGEIDLSKIVSYSGFDPANPSSPGVSYNRVGIYTWPKTHEFIVGIDRELLPNFGLSASFTWRRTADLNWQKLLGVDSSDYVKAGSYYGSLPDCCGAKALPYGVVYYAINPSAIPTGGGTAYETRQGYHRTYKGFEVSATKRMSNRWMARLGFSANSWREYFDDPQLSIVDPTPTRTNPLLNGGLYIEQSTGSGKSNIFMALPKYQVIANGTYLLPYDIDLGANMLIRQGYPTPWYRRTATGDQLTNIKYVLLASDLDQFRLPMVTSLDFRVGKTFKVSTANVIVDLDVFNLFNFNTVLQRQYDQSRTTGATAYTKIMEIMQPRIARIGVRINF